MALAGRRQDDGSLCTRGCTQRSIVFVRRPSRVDNSKKKRSWSSSGESAPLWPHQGEPFTEALAAHQQPCVRQTRIDVRPWDDDLIAVGAAGIVLATPLAAPRQKPRQKSRSRPGTKAGGAGPAPRLAVEAGTRPAVEPGTAGGGGPPRSAVEPGPAGGRAPARPAVEGPGSRPVVPPGTRPGSRRPGLVAVRAVSPAGAPLTVG
jgi:hypothetical protein